MKAGWRQTVLSVRTNAAYANDFITRARSCASRLFAALDGFVLFGFARARWAECFERVEKLEGGVSGDFHGAVEGLAIGLLDVRHRTELANVSQRRGLDFIARSGRLEMVQGSNVAAQAASSLSLGFS